MRSVKFVLVAAAMVCALSVAAQAADCKRVTALGQNFTRDAAELFSTNALKNTLAGQGRVGKGPVRTTCDTGSAMTTCYSSQVACIGAAPKACLGPWLCF